MKMLKPVLAALLSVSVIYATPVLAESSRTPGCEQSSPESFSLYIMTNMKKSDDISKYYQDKISSINLLAEENSWENYVLSSQDLSVSPSGYNSELMDISISISFQIEGENNAINKLVNLDDVYSISSSSYNDQSCSYE